MTPTRNNVEPTTSATDELRRLLDERGVGWWNQTDPEPQTVTMASLGEQLIEYHENVNGTMGYHVWNMCDLTPEQAVAAALGDVPRLPHWWTHDGTLHVEATRMPTRIVVCEGGTCEFVPKRELDASEAENAKLREERDNYKALWEHATVTDCELRRVRAAWKEDREKNAKLRELAGELWAYAEQELLCDENCPYGDTCDWMEPTVVCVFRRRMRELGVEVGDVLRTE